MTVQDRSPESRQRAEGYGFLASLFADPVPAEKLTRLMALAAQSQGEWAGLGSSLLDSLAADEPPNALCERLAVEHARLFRGIQEGYGPPPPYESLWREGQMMGDTTLSTLAAYAETGYRPDDRWGPPDHLAEQLRFVATLANGEWEAWGAGRADDARWLRDRQSAFVAQHMQAWVPAYCQAVEHHAREPFYRALARVTAAAVIDDARILGHD
jgi:TorA maturation chaperone TorD